MDTVHLTYLSLFAVSSILLAWLAIGSARNQDANAAREFFVILLTTAAWAATITIQLAFADDLAVQVLTLYASNLANHALWVTTILFAFAFTNSRERLRHPLVLALLAAGVLTELAILTNPLHGLVWSGYTLQNVPFPHLAYDRGPLFVVAYVVGYTGTAIAVGQLLRHAARSNRFIRRQTGFFVVGVASAAIGNLAYHFGVTPVDTTPLGLLGFAIAASVAIYHYHLFEITPVAYSHVFDEVSNAIVVVDTNDRIALANAAATDIFDTPEDRLVGAHYAHVLPTPVRDHVRTEPDASAVIELDAGDVDTYRISTSTVHAGTDEAGLATTVVLEGIPEFAAQRDQLEHQTAQLQRQTAQLKRQTAQLERQNEQLERFAGTVSHDLRNPLTVARGYATMLAEDDVQYADRILRAFDRMEEIIDDVLVLAREGQSIDDTEPVSLSAVATDAWDSIQAPDATLDVVTDVTLEADPERLRTLLENLFTNAVDHASDSATITVDTLPDGHGFRIADDGPGIPEGDKADVLDHGFTTRPGGTGFGLSIVQQIAEAHGWDVTVTDAEGGGACFEFRIDDPIETSTQPV